MKSVSEVSEFIDAGHFSYAVQPIRPMSGDGDNNTWHEWLVRPLFAEREVTTQEFIEAVESLDLARDLDRRTCSDGIRWLDAQPGTHRLSLNVCGSSMGDPGFTGRILQQIEDSMVLPCQICFDLTAHSALSDLSGATRFVKAVRRMGCEVALDNGIPGNPVLGLLGPLGFVNYLKIDRKWVQLAPESQSHRETLTSIVEYADRLRLSVIAEGVATQDQLSIVRDLGVEFYQGYLDGIPAVVAASEDSRDTIRRVG